MPAILERDEGPYEVQVNRAGSLRFWPKVDGIGRVTVDAGAAATIYDPFGNAIQSSPTVAIDAVNGASRITITVAAISQLDENYYAELTYTPAAANAPYDYLHSVPLRFDVVRNPWGQALVGLDELAGRFPAIRSWLTQHITNLDDDASLSLTVEQVASRWGSLAHAELHRRIKATISEDVRPYAVRPRLIIDRHALQPVETAIALRMIFEAAEDDAGAARALAEDWRRIADGELAAMPPLVYDEDEDGDPDMTVQPAPRFFVTRRVQG